MGAAFSIANLDKYILNYITDFLWDFELAPLRATCRRLRRALPPSKRRTLKQLVTYAVKHDSVPLLQMARKKGFYITPGTNVKHIARRIGKYDSTAVAMYTDGFCRIDIRDVWYGAARGNRNEWCKAQFRESHPYSCHDSILCGAASSGNLELIKWVIKTHPYQNDYSMINEALLYHAAKHNHEDVCRYIKQVFPDTQYHSILYGAAHGGHIELAKSWSNDNDTYMSGNTLLMDGLYEDNVYMCLAALDWKRRVTPVDYDYLAYLAEHTSKELCAVILHYLGTIVSTRIETYGMVSVGNETICEMIFQHMHKDCKQQFLDELLYWAAAKNRSRLCHLAKRWGARDFDSMLKCTIGSEGTVEPELAQEWGGTIKKGTTLKMRYIF